MAIYLCREMTGETSVSLGRRFDTSGAGITGRLDQVTNQLEADGKLKLRSNESERKYLIIEMRPQCLS